jgi:hypothetical protein
MQRGQLGHRAAWLKLDDGDLKRMWDDLLWLGPSASSEARPVTPPPRPSSFLSGNGRSKDSIDDLVNMRKRSNRWTATSPTEASSSPSMGNSPEKANISRSPKSGISENLYHGSVGAGKGEAQTPPTRIVIYDHNDAITRVESPFQEQQEIRPSPFDFLTGIRHSYSLDDDDGAVIGFR